MIKRSAVNAKVMDSISTRDNELTNFHHPGSNTKKRNTDNEKMKIKKSNHP